ncbi:cytochrome P450 [Artomyces pyxidatus]|uniref:Cytochrome P450 n=1 Tax=Artomyces pyxidatus TaxID=48021 RepID=A0ACB8TL97_9AGAM|nr:cytochrome P450 [Artomyces pyxidatus]
MAISYWSLCLLAPLLWFMRRILSKGHAHPLPPGPSGLPLIGNVLDFPRRDHYKMYTKWAMKYGGIVHARSFGQSVIVINDIKVATAMLDKKGSLYSDRPVLQMCCELVGWKNTLVMQRAHGSRLKEMRKAIHGLIGTPGATARHYALFEGETRALLRRVLRDPRGVKESIRRTAGSIILMLAYGYTTMEKDDPIERIADHAMSQFGELSRPGAYLVDVLPVLRYIPAWVPGAKFKRTADNCYKTLQDMANIPFRIAKKELDGGTAYPSFVTTHMEGKDLSEENKHRIKWAAASLYAGGADSTVSTVYTFYLAMTLFPELQRKAQKDIDDVVGNDRLPSFADRANLPYVEALYREVLRWRPAAPLGIPHAVTDDEIHDGYNIPKGSIVVVNVRHILHDAAIYTNPDVFDPDRFIAKEGKVAEKDPRACIFGFGRRICPGLHLGDATVWIAIATTLAVFDVSKTMENGCEITPSGKYFDGIVIHPEPFKCEIKPRSAQAQALILAE